MVVQCTAWVYEPYLNEEWHWDSCLKRTERKKNASMMMGLAEQLGTGNVECLYLRKVDRKKSPMRTERRRKSVSMIVSLTSSWPNMVSQHSFRSAILVFSRLTNWVWIVLLSAMKIKPSVPKLEITKNKKNFNTYPILWIFIGNHKDCAKDF